MTYFLAGLTLVSLLIDVFAIREFIQYIRERDERDTAERERLVRETAEERDRAEQERRALLTRIQTPHLAPALAVEDDPNSNQFVDDTDDDDYWAKTRQD